MNTQYHSFGSCGVGMDEDYFRTIEECYINNVGVIGTLQWDDKRWDGNVFTVTV